MPDRQLEDFWSEFLTLGHGATSGPEMLFRGVTDASHELIPSLGRGTSEHTGGNVDTLERDLLTEFKRLTVPILKTPPTSEFEWLFLAQHYGVPTRLLDWSSNPLVALFFATEQNDKQDGAVYFLEHAVTDQYELLDYKTAGYNDKARSMPASLFALQPDQGEVIFVRPRYSDERYVNQRSVFSCPKDPFSPMKIPSVRCLSVRGSWKLEIRRRLRTLGISTSYMYPGLAGIASEVKSLMFNPVVDGRLKIVTLRMELKLD